MHLFDTDAFDTIRRVISPLQPVTFLDIGANAGWKARRMVECFPRARVWAFEPSPGVAAGLVERTKGSNNIVPVVKAAGAFNGSATFHVTKNDWCGSTLPPSTLGREMYGDWYDVSSTARVEMVRLDDWAASVGVAHVDAMKIDAQGAELDVIRGADRLLRSSVLAVSAEAPLNAEYAGASTFHDVDAALRERGFELFQIHEHWWRGPERRSACLDALWLKSKAVAWLRERPERGYEVDWCDRARQAAVHALVRGHRRIAIYGAGTHTSVVAEVFRGLPLEVVAVIDDDAGKSGANVQGWPIRTPGEALTLRPDAVLLSSNAHENRLWASAERFRGAGVDVMRLYPETEGGVEIAADSGGLSAGSPGAERDAIAAERDAVDESKLAPARVERVAAQPPEAFRYEGYLRLNQRRLEHLASLGLEFHGRRVLEVGAGIGDLTSFWIDRGCRVTCTDGRPENVEHLRSTFADEPRVSVRRLDMERPGEFAEEPYDIVFCYGLLYHLRNPAEAMAYLSRACSGTLLLETCVSFGDHEAMNPVAEDSALHSQAISGVGCRPTRPWVMGRLRALFPHVYVPTTQPCCAEFPIDWTAQRGGEVVVGVGGVGGVLSRSVFVASRHALASPMLVERLPMRQAAA